MKQVSIKEFSSKSKNVTKDFGNSVKFATKRIISDLLHLKWYEYLFLALSGVFLIMTGLYDLVNKTWVWEGKETWVGVLGILSGIAAWTGIVCVFLIGKGKISNYFYGIINNILYGMYAFSVAYTGDALLNLFFFLPMEFVGLYFWYKHLTKGEVVKQRRFGFIQLTFYTILAGGLFAAFWYLIPAADEWLHHDVLKDSNNAYAFTDQPVPHAFDALTNSLSIVAMILMLMAYKEQWLVWIVVNVFQIAMYAGINGWGVNIPMIFMWIVFLINAIYSLWQWWVREKQQAKEIKNA